MERQNIDSLDMSMIAKKLVLSGWKEPHAQEAIRQYKNLLFLWKKYGSHDRLPPSLEIDEVWHAHILDTEKYHEDCLNIFGKYLHHYPYFGIDDKTNYDDLNSAFEQTKKLYRKEFGEELTCIRIDLKSLLKRLIKKA